MVREEWDHVPLGDATLKIGSGATPRGGKSVYIDDGTAFIRSQNVYDNRFSRQGLAYINDDAARALNGVTVEPNDVLINITGESVTRTCIVPTECLPARVSQHVAIIRPNQEKLDSRFLTATLLSPPVKAYLNLLSSAGATRRALTKRHMQELVISLPPLGEQKRIADTLGALDDLIQTNSKLSLSLSELFRETYLRAMRGAQNFQRFGDMATLVRVQVDPSDLVERTPYLGLEHFGIDGAGLVSVGVSTGLDSAKTRFEVGDVLYGKLRPYFRKVAWVGFSGICSTEVWVLRPKAPADQGLLYSVVSSQAFTDFAMAGSGGTHMPRASWDHVGRFPVALPEEHVLAELRPNIHVLWRESVALTSESVRLQRARDELLPLLLSGAIRVDEVAA